MAERDDASPLELAALCAGLAAVVFAVFYPCLRNDFIGIDDRLYVGDPHVAGGFALKNVVWAFTTLRAEFWHPVTWLSFLGDRALWGADAAGYHLTGVLLHAACAALLLLVLVRYKFEPRDSCLCAALFALHPLRVETVAWTAERKGLLNALFVLLTLAAYRRWTGRKSRGRMALLAAFFILSLASKASSIMLPFGLILLDYWPLGRLRDPRSWAQLRPLLAEKRALFAASALSLAVTVAAQGANITSRLESQWPARLANAAGSYLYYIIDTLRPVGLTPLPPFPGIDPPDPFAMRLACVAAAVMALLTAWTWRARRERPYALFGWFWSVVVLLPMAGAIYMPSGMADRYTVLPHIGLALALAGALAHLRRARPGLVAWAHAALAAALVACTWLTRAQIPRWRDDVTLASYSLSVQPGSSVAHNSLAVGLMYRHDGAGAETHLNAALALRPDYIEALNNLGIVRSEQGRHDEALAALRRAAELRPDFNVDYNLAAALAAAGRREEARLYADRALNVREPFRPYALALHARLARPSESVRAPMILLTGK